MKGLPQRTPGPWYEAKTGNHQGLVISEQTGANIAVTYDATDAPFIVRACNSHDDLLAALKQMLAASEALDMQAHAKVAARAVARAAIAKAEA